VIAWKWKEKNDIQANETQKQTGASIFKSYIADFKPKLVRSDKEGHFILIKETMHQDESQKIF
jgi:hypothetical protein